MNEDYDPILQARQRIEYILQIAERAPMCDEDAEEYYLNHLREILRLLEETANE